MCKVELGTRLRLGENQPGLPFIISCSPECQLKYTEIKCIYAYFSMRPPKTSSKGKHSHRYKSSQLAYNLTSVPVSALRVGVSFPYIFLQIGEAIGEIQKAFSVPMVLVRKVIYDDNPQRVRLGAESFL